MTSNFKLILEYDGTPYAGWQVQPDSVTIQGELEKALGIILNQRIRINGSGRTDAGVHARGQVASFRADTDISCSNLKKAVNSLIKGPIVVRECGRVPDAFHARFDAVSKEYHYHILNRPDPAAIGRNYFWHVRQALDTEQMKKCCQLILGEHDFKSFEGAGSPRAHTVRTIYSADVDEAREDRLVIKLAADGFLRFMVRNIVGTLVLSGMSRISPGEFESILKAKDRARAGATAPAHGLFLVRVNYP